MGTIRKIALAVAAALTLIRLAACDSVKSDAGKVATALASLPSVVSASATGNGMQLNRDARSLVAVEVEPTASLSEIEAVVTAWYRASGQLPKTVLAITMPATEVEGDNGFQISRSGYAEQELPAAVGKWYSLTELYSRVTTELHSAKAPGAPYGVTTIVASGASTPSGVAGLVTDLRELGDDPGMTWWLHSVAGVDTAASSVTAFSRNELPDDEMVALLTGFDDAFAGAEAIGGMNLEVATNYDGVYQVRANINPDSLRDVPEADVVGQLETSDAWPVIRSVASTIDSDSSVNVTFSVLGYRAFAELDTTDGAKQTYVQYAALGPVIWNEWAGSSATPIT